MNATKTMSRMTKSLLMLRSGATIGLHNIRRSLFMLLFMSSCGFIMFLSHSFLQDIYRGIRTQGILQNGHLVIKTKSSHEGSAEARQKIISRASMNVLLNKIETIEGVRQYIRVLDISGILGTEINSAIVYGVGADSSPVFGPMRSIRLVEGRSFFISDNESQRGIVGKNLKRIIGINEKEWAILQIATIDGAINLLDVEIIGFSQGFSSDEDNAAIAIPFSYAQTALQTDGAHRIHLLLADESFQETVKVELHNFIHTYNLPVIALDWQEVYPLLDELSRFYNFIFNIITLIIVALSIISIFALISLNIFSRTREIGALRAVGTTRTGLLHLLMGEIGFIYFLATILWIGAGFGIGAFINDADFVYTIPFSNMKVPLSFYLHARHTIVPLVSTLLSVVCASIFPLCRACHLNIAEVLRVE